MTIKKAVSRELRTSSVAQENDFTRGSPYIIIFPSFVVILKITVTIVMNKLSRISCVLNTIIIIQLLLLLLL